MFYRVLLTLSLCLSGLLSVAAIRSQENSVLSLDVSLEKKHDGYALQLQLTNNSAEQVTVQNLDLPWIPPNETIFANKAYRLDKRQKMLVKYGPFADYMDIPHILDPGGSIRGEIDLKRMFPNLAEELKRSKVVVEWACRSKALRFRCKEGSGGRLTISP